MFFCRQIPIFWYHHLSTLVYKHFKIINLPLFWNCLGTSDQFFCNQMLMFVVHYLWAFVCTVLFREHQFSTFGDVDVAKSSSICKFGFYVFDIIIFEHVCHRIVEEHQYSSYVENTQFVSHLIVIFWDWQGWLFVYVEVSRALIVHCQAVQSVENTHFSQKAYYFIFLQSSSWTIYVIWIFETPSNSIGLWFHRG